MPPKKKTLLEKILPFISIETDECIIYPVTNDDGYGSIQTRVNGKKKHYLVHRVVYSHFNNNIHLSRDNIIMHTCDNPPCCNIKHLRLGTHADNSRDKVLKGRQAKGNKIWKYSSGKYTKEEKEKRRRMIPEGYKHGFQNGHVPQNRSISVCTAKQIKKLISESKRVSEIAKIFNVNRTIVSDIKRGVSYKNI